MGYRDETETLRRRLAETEGDLAEARETIGRLTGLSAAPETGVTEERSALIGAPRSVHLERELEFEVSDEGLEAIAALLRGRTPNLTVSQVGRSLSAPGFSLRQADGRTTIAMDGDYRGATAGALSGAGLGGAFGAMATMAVVHDAFVPLPETQMLMHLLWLGPLFMVLLFLLLRTRFANTVERQSTQLRATFEAAVELAKRHRVREAPKVRVQLEAETGEVEASEEPELAEEVEPPELAAEIKSGA